MLRLQEYTTIPLAKDWSWIYSWWHLRYLRGGCWRKSHVNKSENYKWALNYRNKQITIKDKAFLPGWGYGSVGRLTACWACTELDPQHRSNPCLIHSWSQCLDSGALGWEFKVILGCTASLRPVWTTRDPAAKHIIKKYSEKIPQVNVVLRWLKARGQLEHVRLPWAVHLQESDSHRNLLGFKNYES